MINGRWFESGLRRLVRTNAATTVAVLLSVAALCLTTTVLLAAGRVERSISVSSKTLGQALKRELRFSVYRPARVRRGRRLPVLYLLHGHGDDENAWLRYGSLARTLNRLIKRKELQPLLVVMPMAGNSWYVDDKRGAPGYGAVASALSRDLVDLIERRYSTAACRSGRAVGGLSMGGFGAVQLAFTNPDRYAAVISLSGSLFSRGLTVESKRYARFMDLFAGVYGQPFDVAHYNRFNAFALLPNLAASKRKPQRLAERWR